MQFAKFPALCTVKMYIDLNGSYERDGSKKFMTLIDIYLFIILILILTIFEIFLDNIFENQLLIQIKHNTLKQSNTFPIFLYLG